MEVVVERDDDELRLNHFKVSKGGLVWKVSEQRLFFKEMLESLKKLQKKLRYSVDKNRLPTTTRVELMRKYSEYRLRCEGV